MKASERLEKINDLSEELQNDIESTQDNHNDIRSDLISAINGLDDIGVNYPDFNQVILDVDASKESELNDLIDKYIEKISDI